MSSSKLERGQKPNADGEHSRVKLDMQTDPLAKASESLQWGPVREGVQMVHANACYLNASPAFNPEMDAVEWLDKLEDFFCSTGV
ncbi:hypothetical protein T4D_16361 [Trichinella pseudospiralis]|uniref:Uncharacterized protein n=1 Tax=Trichinella pseudospiralis TaxID=6337 RepID=A0A0V1FK00_TRIPS|nr:hypothetical protein T4D_16361 [Trichinella pseudospiralis]